MTVKQAAEMLEVSIYTVYRMCQQGLLAYYRVGTKRGTIRLQLPDVEAYKTSRRVEACGPETRPLRISPRSRPPIRDIIGEIDARKRQKDDQRRAGGASGKSA